MTQQKLYEAEAEIETRNWKKRNSDFTFQEINQEFESQRFQLHQVSRWTDQTQRDKISLYGELELRNTHLPRNHVRITQELKTWEVFVTKKQIEQDKQELMNYLCIKRESWDRESIIDPRFRITEQSKFLVGYRRMLRSWTRKQLGSDPRSRSSLYYSESQNHA